MRARDRGRAFGRIVALGAALAVICPAAPGTAVAQPVERRQQQQQQPQQKRVYKIYVMGDSYSSGEGVKIPVQIGRSSERYSYFDVQDPRHQSTVGAAVQAAARLQAANPDIQVEVHVVASSGATTSDVFEDQRKDALDGSGRRKQDGTRPETWHDDDDLRVNSAQIAQIPADADVVIIGFGGNDAFFAPLVRSFVDDQAARPGIMQKLEQLLDKEKSAEYYRREAADSKAKGYEPTLIARLLQVMTAVQDRARHAKLVVQNYPLAADPAHSSQRDLLDKDALQAMRDFGARLNEVIERAVEICGCATLADVSDALRGRELNTADPAINSVGSGFYGRTQEWPQQQPLHPNLKGVGLMADPIAGALARQLGLQVPQAQGDRLTDTGRIKLRNTTAPDTDGDGRPDFSDGDRDGDGTRNSRDKSPNTPDKPTSPSPDQPRGDRPAAPPARGTGPSSTEPGGNGTNRTPAPAGRPPTRVEPPRGEDRPPTPPPTEQRPQPQQPQPQQPRPQQPQPQPQRPQPQPQQPQPQPQRPERPPQQPQPQQPQPPQPPSQQPPPQSSGGSTTQSSAARKRPPVIPAATPMRSPSYPSVPTTPATPRFDPNFGPPGSPKPSQLGGGLAGVTPPAPPKVHVPAAPKPSLPLGGGKPNPRPKPDGSLSTAPSGSGGGGGSSPAPSGPPAGGGSAPAPGPMS